MSPRALKYDDMRSGGTVGFRGSRTGDRMRLVSPIDPRDWIELEVGRFPLTDSEQLHYRELDDGKLIYEVTFTLGNKVEVEPDLVANADAADRSGKEIYWRASSPLPSTATLRKSRSGRWKTHGMPSWIVGTRSSSRN